MSASHEISSSDDDAPEEVALSVGKSQATTRRKQERASEAEHRQLLTSRRKRKRSSEATAQLGDLPQTSKAGSHRFDAGQAEQDELPEDVIKALTSV